MKSTILYLILIPSIIAMVYSIRLIRKDKSLSKLSKAVFIYLTILIPFLGLILTAKLGKQNN